MGKYLRIKNRGRCPRIYLKIVGLSTKSGRVDDPSQGGWFGSGTKYAPIAALNLGISVAILSSDHLGMYCFQYVARQIVTPIEPWNPESPTITAKQLYWLVTDRDGTSIETETPFSLDGCRNWKEPLGDDEHRAFRVLREYLRNAIDADPDGFGFEFVDDLAWPEDGMTYAYLSASQEIRRMLRQPERYFKYAKPAPAPIATFTNGRIFPKSDPDRTRVFSQGTLAYCSKEPSKMSLYDYCVDVKTNHEGRQLLTEERTFSDMSLVHQEIKRMLEAWDDVPRLADIIRKIEAGEAAFENETLAYLGKPAAPAAARWAKAWHLVYDQPALQRTAVLSTNAYYDELASYSYKKRPIVLRRSALRDFLKKCGVEESFDCVPHMTSQEFRLVEEKDLEDWEKTRLQTAIAVMRAEFPESEHMPIKVWEPLVGKIQKTAGFTSLDVTPSVLYLQRGCLRSMDMTLKTLAIHECRHGITKVDDSSRVFIEKADSDILRLLQAKYGFQPEPEIDLSALPLPKIAP